MKGANRAKLRFLVSKQKKIHRNREYFRVNLGVVKVFRGCPKLCKTRLYRYFCHRTGFFTQPIVFAPELVTVRHCGYEMSFITDISQ